MAGLEQVPAQLATADATTLGDGPERVEQHQDKDLVVEELLVEDVSIDGMCGVY
jgi:mycofactocin precursor